MDRDLRELINIEDFHIIDRTRSNDKVYEFSQFYELIKDEWRSEAYLNEYDGVNETRLFRGKSFLQKEALKQNQLGNSEILDASIIIVDNHNVQFYVGMPINVVKELYPLSYSRSRDFVSNLRKMFLNSVVDINGRTVVADVGGLTIIYNKKTGKVERIYSRW
ncbi:hypothetical protein GCM10007940_26000 [Portibacter lacus]|uniref:Uncharacterized protein n=1 Tax=Portibacter lacus TaxID=1099794 RepID=A0AA37WGI2_9BACT|nr:hypothetical protein GCM10007940_26000 [Portibacter lacus]